MTLAPQTEHHTLHDVRLHDGTVLPALALACTTLGAADGEPVLLLHGSQGSAASWLTPAWAGRMFGPGQPLDAARHHLILPDALGSGQSAKPSDGLGPAFPAYTYGDMVAVLHRLLTEALGIRHLRAVIGFSMGGMHTWLLAGHYPGWMDIAVPMAASPVPMGGRNWLLRRMLCESIRRDPAWQGGRYTTQPPALAWASTFFALASNGGEQALRAQAPDVAAADALLTRRLAAPFTGDANDHLWQWEAARDYDPTPGLDRIRARVLAITSADDERNPPELGVLERELQRVRHGAQHIVPGSPSTGGHGTLAQAALWKAAVADVLKTAPPLD